MSARLLVLVMPGQERAALSALATLVATARGAQASIRVASLRPLPPPREDRHGRIVADTDQEMERIRRTTIEAFATAARVFRDVRIEPVVRFGQPRHEAQIETEAYQPDFVARFEGRVPLAAIRYLVTGARRKAASASAASRATRSAAFWRRAMRTP